MRRRYVPALGVILALWPWVSVPYAYVQRRLAAGQLQKWASMPISYAVNKRGCLEISDSSEFPAVRAAFQTWGPVTVVPLVVDGLAFNELPRTDASGLVQDGVSTVSWIEDASNPSAQPDVLARTARHPDPDVPANIVEADIVLNGVHFSWTTTGPGSYTSQSGPADIQEIVTHEIGHFLGLVHVTTEPSILVPGTYVGSIRNRTLSQDEISAVQVLYPSTSTPPNSSISGSVTTNGVGVAGAYVVAYQSGRPVVGAIADDSGVYRINRVPPGAYVVRAQPYSRGLSDGVDDYYDSPAHVQGDFLSFFSRDASPRRTAEESGASTVIVTEGLDTPNVNVEALGISCDPATGDPFEPNNTAATAKVINVEGRAQIHQTCATGDEEWANFTAQPGKLYVIETADLGYGVSAGITADPDLALFDATGDTRLDEDSDDPDKYTESDDKNPLESDLAARIVWRETDSQQRVRTIKAIQKTNTPGKGGLYFSLSVTELAGPGAPTVTSVEPARVTVDGGIIVTVRGTGFTPGAQVDFSSLHGTEENVKECVSLVDCRAISVRVPGPQSQGSVTVTVTNRGGGAASLPNGFTYVGKQIGTFVEGSGSFGPYLFGHGTVACWGDYDNDGDPDLYSPYIGSVDYPPPIPQGELWRNNGDGTFTDVTVSAGLNQTILTRATCAWGDYDNDGDLDLVMAYSGVGPGTIRLYKNNGDPLGTGVYTFTDVAPQALLSEDPNGGVVDAAWADYDQDGWLDLYVASGGAGINRLFHNKGNGTFEDKAGFAGVATAGASGRALWADYDNDGWPDLYLVRRSGQPDILYHNDAKRGNEVTFSNATQAAGIVEGSNCADAAWADFNNDHWLDVICVGDSLTGSDPQRFWINQGNRTFIDQADHSGINSLGRHATAVTVLDKDNDGLVDVYVGCSWYLGWTNEDVDALLQNNDTTPIVFTNVAAPPQPSPSGIDELAYPRDPLCQRT